MRALLQKHPAALGALALLALYAFTIPQNHSETEDAFDYAYRVRAGSASDLVFPHHLIYLPAARALYSTGLFPDAFKMMIGVNVLLGVGGVMLTYRLLRDRFELSARAAFVASAFLAFSYGYWRYAVAAEVYIPAVSAQALLCLAAFAAVDHIRRALLCGLLASVAVATHGPLSAPLAVVAVPIYFLLTRRFRTLFIYAGTGVAAVCFAYYMGWRAESPDAAGLREFVAFVKGPPEEFRPFSPATLAKAVLGFGATLVATNVVFTVAPLVSRVEALMPYRNLTEELFMARNFSPLLAGVSLALAAALGAIAIYIVARLRFDGRARNRLRARPAIAALAVWLLAYAALVIAVHPDSPELWICFLLPLALSAGVALDAFFKDRALRAPIAFCGLLFAYNLCGMAMIRAQSSDLNAQKAAWVLKEARNGDDIYTRDADVFTRYVRYHAAAGVNAVNCWSRDAAETEVLLEGVRPPGARRFVFDDVFEPPSYLVARTPEIVEGLAAWKGRLKDRLRPTADPHVYSLDPSPPPAAPESGTTSNSTTAPPLAR